MFSRESFVKKRDEKEENINTPTKRKEHVGQLPRAQAEAEELLERLAAGAAPDREEINAVFFFISSSRRAAKSSNCLTLFHTSL